MQADSQQRWNLFGYDLSRGASFIRAGWRELIRGRQAGIRRRLEAPVALKRVDGSHHYYIAEAPVDTDELPRQSPYEALQLPPESVLLKELALPASLELELDSAMALEAQSSSPFPRDNTCHGWTLLDREEGKIRVLLAIVALDDIEAFLEQSGVSGNELPEIWVLDEQGRPVVMQGFGENRRQQAYSRQVAVFGTRLGLLLLGVILLAAVPAVVRDMQTERMEGHLQEAQDEASRAQALREQLVSGNERIQRLQTLLNEQVDYHFVLDSLSRAPDSIFLQSFEVDGSSVRIVGWAENAAGFMEALVNHPAILDVSSPSAFNRNQRSGLERFVLDLELPTVGES